MITRQQPINSIVRLDDERTMDMLKDCPGDTFNFFLRDKKRFCNEDDQWTLFYLEHCITKNKVLLVRIDTDKVAEFRVYIPIMEGMSRQQAFEDQDWLFNVGDELDGVGDLQFVYSITDDEGGEYLRKTKNEMYGETAIVEYYSEGGDPPEFLIIEQGSINYNGGWIEIYDGVIINEFDIHV